jgi:hypothetical protein
MLDQLYSVTALKALQKSAVLLLLLAIGCSPSKRVAGKGEEPAKERKLSLAQYESTLNPSDYDEEIEIVQKAHAEENGHGQLTIPKDSTIVQEEMIQGYRIQIFSSSNIDDANAAKKGAEAKFPNDSVYIVFDTPVYKVRVGDFVNRYDASQRLPEFVDKGYRDAWIVPDQIEQRKIVRVPIQK